MQRSAPLFPISSNYDNKSIKNNWNTRDANELTFVVQDRRKVVNKEGVVPGTVDRGRDLVTAPSS